MNNHTTARNGKMIQVILKDGTMFKARLKEIKSKYYEFEEVGRVDRQNVRSFSIHRQKK